uniref:Transketolase n=1 Tax=Panagrellus redivivus TaxID=6233 RepID=A0A7E4W0B8_PANRE
MLLRRFWNEWSFVNGNADALNILHRAAEQRRAENARGLPHVLVVEGDFLPHGEKSTYQWSPSADDDRRSDSTTTVKDG